MASADSVYPFDNPILNELVDALVALKCGARTTGGDASGEPLRMPPLSVPEKERGCRDPLDPLRLSPLSIAKRKLGSDAPRDPLQPPPPRIPKRNRSRQINLQGIRDAERLKQQEEKAKKKASAALVHHCNGNGLSLTKKKKARSAALTRARKDPVPEPPKFVMHETGPLKLVIRKVTSDKEEDNRNRKRKIDDAGLAEGDMSNMKKIKLMSKS